jgi:hypothetical protein
MNTLDRIVNAIAGMFVDMGLFGSIVFFFLLIGAFEAFGHIIDTIWPKRNAK